MYVVCARVVIYFRTSECTQVNSARRLFALKFNVGVGVIAGLFKGSVTPDSEGSHYGKLERPTSLNRLKSVYAANAAYVENGCDDGQTKGKYQTNTSAVSQANSTMTNGGGGGSVASADSNVSMSILSPFDEQEEWAKISEIMASFGSNFNRESIVAELEQEFDSRLGESNTYLKLVLV